MKAYLIGSLLFMSTVTYSFDGLIPLKTDLVCANSSGKIRLQTEVKRLQEAGSEMYTTAETGSLLYNNEVFKMNLWKMVSIGRYANMTAGCDWDSKKCSKNSNPQVIIHFDRGQLDVSVQRNKKSQKLEFSNEECILEGLGTDRDRRSDYILIKLKTKNSVKTTTYIYPTSRETYNEKEQNCKAGWSLLADGAIFRRTKSDCSTFTIVGDGAVLSSRRN